MINFTKEDKKHSHAYCFLRQFQKRRSFENDRLACNACTVIAETFRCVTILICCCYSNCVDSCHAWVEC